MRIVQLANLYAPTSGGLRVAVDALGSGYRAAGLDRVLVVPGPRDADVRTPDGRVITVAAPPLDGTYRLVVRTDRVRRLLDDLQPDRLEVSDKLTLAGIGRWASARGVPAVLVSHERTDLAIARLVRHGRSSRRLADRWHRRLVSGYRTVVACSAWAGEEFDRLGTVALRTVPLGVDLDRFRPGIGGREPGPLRLVSACRLYADKHPELVVDTVADLVGRGRDVRLTMIGSGPRLTALRRRARGLPVDFVGFVPDRARLAELLAVADIGLAPCPHETFGLAPLEMLACGTPVVTVDAGAVPELVAAGGGRAVPPTPLDLAEAVLEVEAQPRRLRQLAARARAECYPWSRSVEAMLAVHRVAVRPERDGWARSA